MYCFFTWALTSPPTQTWWWHHGVSLKYYQITLRQPKCKWTEGLWHPLWFSYLFHHFSVKFCKNCHEKLSLQINSSCASRNICTFSRLLHTFSKPKSILLKYNSSTAQCCVHSPWLSKTTLKCPPRVCSVNKHRHKLENTRTIPFCIDTTVIQWSCELLPLHVWLFNSINVSSTMPADSQQWQWFILNHTNQLTEELQTGWPDSLTVTIHRSV